MEEALTYLATLTLFSFVLVGAALIRHEMLLLASIPPVFVAMITGFVMMLYAEDRFGLHGGGAVAGGAGGVVVLATVCQPGLADLRLSSLGRGDGAGADRVQFSRPRMTPGGRSQTSTTTYSCSTVTGTVSATYGPSTTRSPAATSTA